METSAAQDTAPLPPHAAGAGAAWLRAEWGLERFPEATPEDEARVDALIEWAGRMMRDGRATRPGNSGPDAKVLEV